MSEERRTVYVVVGWPDWESSTNLRAFVDREDAEAFKERCVAAKASVTSKGLQSTPEEVDVFRQFGVPERIKYDDNFRVEELDLYE